MEQPTQTYKEWKACITAYGGIQTKDAVRERITALSSADVPETRRFVEAYGSDRLQQVLGWLKRLEREL